MEKRIIECVPNFSEGRDMSVIRQITGVIESVEGVKLLDVDPGKDTNRSVVTFVGDPEAVSEAAFLGVKKASEVIDMSRHHGEHQRMGATDVCPFVPVSGITMEETVDYARRVAERIGRELGIPVYCYENAAYKESRRNLADCRAGEYEGLREKLADPEWKPDFGPAIFNEKTGATAVGARDFLVAFNINLNTTSTRRANAIAFDVREKGRNIRNEKGETINLPGSLKKVKAIGWYIKEYGVAQISMNLTDISVTPVHIAFDEVCWKAEKRGIRVTGSELVGLIPLKAILDAGKYFLEKQHRSVGVPDTELIKIAVKSMGLDDIHPFDPSEKIIEYIMSEKNDTNLVNLTLRSFMENIASDSPAPGGGSVSSYIGSMGVALGTMIANLSSHKRGWDDRWKEFSDWAAKGKEIQNILLDLVNEDALAYNRIIEAGRLSPRTEEEKTIKHDAVQNALKYAIKVPFMVMETALEGISIVRKMAETGNPASASDAGVGIMTLLTCMKGAFLNIRTNITGLDDKAFSDDMIKKADELLKKAVKEEGYIMEVVDSMIKKQQRSG